MATMSEEEQRAKKNGLVGQIPGSAPPGWTGGTGHPVEGNDFTRNVNNSLNALGGMGAVANVPLRGAAGAAMMNAPPVLQSAAPRIGMTKPAADFVAGMGPAAQAAPAANAIPQAVGAAPKVVAGLYEGSQANAAAAGARTLAGASAAATSADANRPMAPQPAGRSVSGGLTPLNPNAPTASAPFQLAPQQAQPVVAQPSPGPMDATAVADRKAASGLLEGFKDVNNRMGAAIADVGTMPLRGIAGAYDSAVVRPMRAAGFNAAYLSPNLVPTGANVDSMTPFYDQIRARDQAATSAQPGQPGPQAKPPGAVPGAGDATMPGADIGRFSAPTPKGPPVNSGNTAPDGSPLMDDPGKIRRIDAPGKSPLFTNVSDAGIGGNDALQNRGFVSAQNQQAAQNLSDRYAAERSPAQSQYAAEVADAARVNAETMAYLAKDKLDGRLYGKDREARVSARLQMADVGSTQRAGMQEAASANRDAAALQRTSMEQQGWNARFGMTNQLDQQKDAREQSKFGFDAKSQMQVQAAQKALLSAKTPEERQSAMETLAGLQGKYSPKDNTNQHRFTVVPGGQVIDEKTGMPRTVPSYAIENNTGKVVTMPGNGQQAQSGPPVVKTPQDLAALKSGEKFVDVNGVERIKK